MNECYQCSCHRKHVWKSKFIRMPGYGYVGCRIEIDLSDKSSPKQRHIWIREDGTENNEEWIKSLPDTPEKLLKKGWSNL